MVEVVNPTGPRVLPVGIDPPCGQSSSGSTGPGKAGPIFDRRPGCLQGLNGNLAKYLLLGERLGADWHLQAGQRNFPPRLAPAHVAAASRSAGRVAAATRH